MKAISLWQPWASALFLRYERHPLKPDETRGWPIAYRGRLAIHAAKFKPRPNVDYDPVLDHMLVEITGRSTADLPFGAILGSVDLISCKKAAEVAPHRWTYQLLWGDYRERGDDGKLRFAWACQDPQLLKCPIPWKGAQGLFEVPDSLFPQPEPTEFQLKP